MGLESSHPFKRRTKSIKKVNNNKTQMADSRANKLMLLKYFQNHQFTTEKVSLSQKNFNIYKNFKIF